MYLPPCTAATHLTSERGDPVRGGTGGTLISAKCRLAGNGGSTGSGAAVDKVKKQAGGRQLLRGGMGGAAGNPSSSLAMGSGSGGVVGAGGERKT